MASIDEAFQTVDRREFVPEDAQQLAGYDTALPIGFGQTISQPTVVRLMLEWLDPLPADKILDVGSGSGWTTALLSKLVGPGGKVYAVEKVPELVDFGRDNCRRTKVKNAKFYLAGESYGLPRFAPYDRILVSAAAQKVPKELLSQLKIGGTMVIPVNENILVIEKNSHKDYEMSEHFGFVFVPLVE